MTTSSAFALRSLSNNVVSVLRVAYRTSASVLFLVSFFALSPVLLQAQGTAPAPAAPPVAAPAPAPVAAPQNPGGVSAPSGYVLSANDQVAVEVFGEEDLRANARLNGEGNLSLPLLGSVRLSGLTLTQAAARLTELYGKDYLVNPKVNVTLLGYAKRRFTVLGQVNRPGSYEMPEGSPGGIDLLEAVAMAGGYTRVAAPERISVRRPGPGGEQVLRVDGKRVSKGGGAFRVAPGDTITVGESIF